MAETKAQAPTKVQKSAEEWRKLLTPEQFHVMFEKGTERAFTGALVNNHADGIYHCGACNAPLFRSETKFESGSGWPSFFTPISATAVEAHEDHSYGMRRVEATCATCGAHLGHVFPDGRGPPAIDTASTARRWRSRRSRHTPRSTQRAPAASAAGALVSRVYLG